MKKYVGLAGAKGQVVLKAIIFKRKQISVEKRHVENVQEEIESFQLTRRVYAESLQSLYNEALNSIGEDSAKIFKAYEMIVNDDIFFDKPLKAAEQEGINVDYAVYRESLRVSEKFVAMGDPYMKERATDIVNVCNELIRRRNKVTDGGLPQFDEPFLVVAEDLTPEDTVRIDKKYLGGFITERGGITSHSVILAKTLGIPAVVGAAGILQGVRDGQMLYLNGDEGYGVVEPDEAFIADFTKQKVKLDVQKELFAAAAHRPAVTADGHQVAVCINTGDSDSINAFDAGCCDGIGLFRTEFLFMGQRDYPSEELQLSAYKELAEKARGMEVIIRTLDIGGDKQLDYMDIPRENNPFLGYRAIRICLNREEVFLTQLRAILRASAFGHVKIMFPMIVTCEELLEARALVEKAKQDLRRESVAFDEAIEVGIMIETPASVLISDKLAKHSDFFSIGTNDLIQYTTATDRMNEKVQYLYDPCNLSVLRALEIAITNAHNAGIPVGMCGEMASDERLVPLLLGMGLDEFSVVPSQVGRLKYIISRLDYKRLQGKVKEILDLSFIGEVKKHLAEFEVL